MTKSEPISTKSERYEENNTAYFNTGYHKIYLTDYFSPNASMYVKMKFYM